MRQPPRRRHYDVWLIRAGKFGERDQWCLEKGSAAGGWREVADLTDATTRPKVRKLVEDAFPTQPAAFHANHTGQLHALRNRIAVGDIVVLPLKTTRHLALGTVSCGYRYLADEADPDRRHTIGVEWTRTDVPRTAIKQDLLYSLGAFLTVCEISRNDGAWRLQQVLETGQDPGARSSVPTQATDDTEDSDPSDSSATEIDVVQVAADRIQVAIGERFAGYRLAELVAAVLRPRATRVTPRRLVRTGVSTSSPVVGRSGSMSRPWRYRSSRRHRRSVPMSSTSCSASVPLSKPSRRSSWHGVVSPNRRARRSKPNG